MASKRDRCIVNHTVRLETIFSTMSVSTKPTLHCCSPIDPQYWVTYVKAPTMGHLGADLNNGSSPR